MALTEKQARFVAEYLVDLNATAAAKRANYSDKTAYSQGQRLLKNVEIQEAIQKAVKERSERTEITQDSVLQELAAIGFSRATDYAYIDELGKVAIVSTGELTDTQKKAVAVIERSNNGPKIRLHDKVRALELIGKHLGMFDTRTPPTAEGESNLLDVLMAGTEEDMNTDDLPEVQ